MLSSWGMFFQCHSEVLFKLPVHRRADKLKFARSVQYSRLKVGWESRGARDEHGVLKL